MQKYLQIPYRFNGRNFDGCDCYGLIILRFKNELGIDLLDYKHGYSKPDQFSDSNYLLENIFNEFEKVEPEKAEKHDVILIRHESENADHIGMLTSKKMFMHSLTDHGVVQSKISIWRRKIVGFYRHKGLKKCL